MPKFLSILPLLFWYGTNVLATESLAIKDISSYEEVKFISPTITRQAFEKPVCGEKCENKIILGIGFIHREELVRESSLNTKYLVNSELAGTNVWFPYFVERKILSDKDFTEVTPYTLASKIKGELSNKTSAIVIYDGNGVGRLGKYPEGGVYLPEDGQCESLRKKLEQERINYLSATVLTARQKALADYKGSFIKYQEKVCHDRVLAYQDLIASLTGPDLFFVESSQKLNGRSLKNQEHGLFDYSGRGEAWEVKIFSANITSEPEKTQYLSGESSYYRAFEIIKNSTRNLDKDYNCQITMNEVFDELKAVNVTSGLKGDLKPIFDWQTQREHIKKSATDFVSNPGAYSQSYKASPNASGFTVIVNNKHCKNIQSDLDSLTKQILADSPSHRITEGMLARVPSVFSVKETELQISMDMNLLSAQLTDNLIGKYLYGKASVVDYYLSAQAGAAANVAEQGLKTADMIAHPVETKDKLVEGAKNVKDYFYDEQGNRLDGDKVASKLMEDGKMLVKEGTLFVVKDCRENLCRESVKSTIQLASEITLGGGTSVVSAKAGTTLLKGGGELLGDAQKAFTTTDEIIHTSKDLVAGNDTITKKLGSGDLNPDGADEAGLQALADAGFDNYKKPASSSPKTLVSPGTVSPKVEKVTTMKPLADGIGESDMASMQGTHNWWNDLNRQARSSDPEIASQATKKIELSHQIIKEQMDTGVPYTAVSPDAVKSIQDAGYIAKGRFFSHPETGPHVNHGGQTAYIKCKTPACTDQYFPSKKSDTGSGIQNEYDIPINDLEIVYVDHNKIENTIRERHSLSEAKITSKAGSGNGKMSLIENVKGDDALNGIAVRYKNPDSKTMEEGFVFGDKVGSHHNLIDRAKGKYGEDTEIIWLGEAKVSNGKITKMNETAGTLKENPMLKSKVEGIEAAQRISKQDNVKQYFASNSSFDKYVEGNGPQHVMDGLSGASYMRHDAQNKISVFMLGMANRLEKGLPLPSKGINLIRQDASEILKHFEAFRRIPNNGLSGVESAEFQSILQSMVNGGEIQAQQLKRLNVIYSKIKQRVQDPKIEMTSDIILPEINK